MGCLLCSEEDPATNRQEGHDVRPGLFTVQEEHADMEQSDPRKLGTVQGGTRTVDTVGNAKA